MKSTELRIGNYISVGYDIQVVDVLCDCVNTVSHEGLPIDAIEPIPLTEEWLLKFGFEKKSLRYNKKGVCLAKFKYENYITFEGWRSKPIDLYGVHQLQNLYFALTGEELIWKN